MGIPLMLLAPAAIQAGTSLAGYLGRRKRGPFEDTAYGQYLSRIKEEGRYSPTAKANILGQVSGQAGAVAQRQKVGLRGYLESTGMGRSIAGAKLLSSPGRGVMREVAGATRDIELENELAKLQAGREYGLGKMQYGERRGAEEAQARQQLFGGLGGALASGITTGIGYKAAEEAGIPFEIPENFASMSPQELFEFAQNAGITGNDYGELENAWFDARAEEKRKGMQKAQSLGWGMEYAPERRDYSQRPNLLGSNLSRLGGQYKTSRPDDILSFKEWQARELKEWQARELKKWQAW